MLDAASTFDRLVHEQTANPKQAEAILQNPVYRAISGSLAGAQEYMAIERLHQLHTSGKWDLVIVDTPPSRHAIDLLEAPDRLIGFLSHPVYRTLTVGPAGVREGHQRRGLDVPVGRPTTRRTADRRGHRGVLPVARQHRARVALASREVSALLRSDAATFVVVSSPRAEAIGEAEHLIGALRDGNFPFAGVVVNLIHPLPVPLTPADRAALGRSRCPAHSPIMWPGTTSSSSWRPPSARRSAALKDLAEDVVVVELPLLAVDVHDVAGTGRSGRPARRRQLTSVP